MLSDLSLQCPALCTSAQHVTLFLPSASLETLIPGGKWYWNVLPDLCRTSKTSWTCYLLSIQVQMKLFNIEAGEEACSWQRNDKLILYALRKDSSTNRAVV